MSEVIYCAPMPDEPIWSQYRRMLWLNNTRQITTRETAGLIVRGRKNHAKRHGGVIALLAGSSEPTVLRRYFLQHSFHPQVFSPWMLDVRDWYRQLLQWACVTSNDLPGKRVWRYCQHCVTDDVKEFGFSWYRRAHQYQGVNWCSKHSEGLIVTAETPSIYWPYPRGNDWHRPLVWRAPSSIPRPSKFAARYLHALAWLHESQNRPYWAFLRAELDRRNWRKDSAFYFDNYSLIPWVRKNAAAQGVDLTEYAPLPNTIETSVMLALCASLMTKSLTKMKEILDSAKLVGAVRLEEFLADVARAKYGRKQVAHEHRELSYEHRSFQNWLMERDEIAEPPLAFRV